MPFYNIEIEDVTSRERREPVCEKSEPLCERIGQDVDLTTRYRLIEDALDLAGDPEPPSTEERVTLSLRDALSIMPVGTVREDVALTSADEQMLRIEVPDLYGQLAAGRVTMKTSLLAFFIPSHLLDCEAFEDTDSEVVLPLKALVGAVGFGALRRHSAVTVRRYANIDRLAEPFSVPRLSVDRATVSGGAAIGEVDRATESPTAVEPAMPPLPVPEVDAPREAPVPISTDFSDDYHEVLGNVNINTADLSELMSLDGVSEAVATRILQHRETYGPFKDIFDLRQVPRIGRQTFRRMTGMPYSLKRHHRGRHLARMLRMPAECVSDLDAIAKTLASRPGFSGCVISDADGLLVAQDSAGVFGDTLSAVVPRITRQIQENMNIIEAGCLDSVSICIAGQMLTIVSNCNVALTAIHQESRVTKSQLALIRKVGCELAWLLSHRAYAA